MQALGLPATPFVVCTALGAVVAFLTPIGHHGTLLILDPGAIPLRRFFARGLAADRADRPGQRLDGALVVLDGALWPLAGAGA